jgi:hypothetical protein
MTRTKTENPKPSRTLEPIGLEEMKAVAGGEVGAVLAALRAYCEPAGLMCDGAIRMTNEMYGSRSSPYSVARF